MKKNRSAMLLILAILVISMTFSCNGLFTPQDKADGMGTLTIDCFGTGARTAAPDGSDVDLYKVSVIDEKGEVVVPATDVTKDNPKFEKSIPAGTYSVIVQAIVNNIDTKNPEYIGRKNGIVIKEKETTSAEITMVPIMIECDLPREVYLPKPVDPDWGCGKLPENITVDGYDFLGYFTDVTFTQKITDIPDTTDYENLVIPIAHFKKSTTTSAQDGVFYASGTGTGDGTTPSSPMSVAAAFQALGTYAFQTGATPTLYLLEDVTLPDTSSQQISFSVNIIGKKDNVENAKVTVKGSGGSGTAVAKFGNSGTFTVKNVIVDGESMRKGIDNAGILTLENCLIKNCSNGGISLSAGTATLSQTSISGCTITTEKGKSIYCNDGTTINGTTWDSAHWINDDIAANSDLSASSSLWQSAAPAYSFPPAGTTGVYYVTQNGSGNESGTDPDNTASFHNVFVDMNNRFTLENCTEDGCPRIYILSDIANADMIKRKVKCIGVNISNGNGNITITGKCKNNASEMPYTLVCNFEGIILENITIDSENARCGIDNRNTLTLNHCIIKNCANDTSAGMSGPGINTSANLTLNYCEITNCHNENYDGGGINAFSGTVSISNSSITDCSANNGGGIYIDNGCKLTMTDSTISSCTASRGGGISINCSSRGTNNPVSFTNCKVTGCTGTSGQASICASTSTGYVGSNEDLTSADVWNTAISGMVFTNWNQAVTYNE